MDEPARHAAGWKHLRVAPDQEADDLAVAVELQLGEELCHEGAGEGAGQVVDEIEDPYELFAHDHTEDAASDGEEDDEEGLAPRTISSPRAPSQQISRVLALRIVYGAKPQ